MTVLEAVRATRDRVLVLPTWALLVGVFVVSRLVTAAIVQTAAVCCQNPAGVADLHPGYEDMVGLWDGAWYRRIVESGYPIPLPVDGDTGEVTFSAWAFYPLFPYAVRALTASGLSFDAAAQLLNLPLALLAVLLAWRLFSARADVLTRPSDSTLYQRMAVLAAGVWCFYPATAVLQIAYSEAVATCLLAGFLLALIHRRYWLAVLMVVLLGFARAVAPPLGVVVLVHLVVRMREERRLGLPLLHGARVVAPALLLATGISAVAWPVLVGLVSGDPRAFFTIQAKWGQEPGKGPFVAWLTWAWDQMGIVGVLVLLALVVAYIALATGRHGRWLAVELRTWALAYPLFLLAVTRPITSMWRFLLLDFPLAAILVSIVVRGAEAGGVEPTWPRRLGVAVVGLVAGMAAWTVVLLTYTPWFDGPP